MAALGLLGAVAPAAPGQSCHCFGCRKPIVVGQKWLELVSDNNRARFHCDCEPVWRAERETFARKTLWGRVTGDWHAR